MLAVCAACASAHRRVDAPGRALTPSTGAPSKLPDGWVHEPVTAAMDPASPFGYYVLRPTNASAHPPPLLIHLSDQAQSGPGTVASLERLLRVGPAKLIRRGAWAPPTPMIVVTPQLGSLGGRDDDSYASAAPDVAKNLSALVPHLVERFGADNTRVYASAVGSGAAFLGDFLAREGAKSGIAAAVAISGLGDHGLQELDATKLSAVPLWAFHQEGSEPRYRKTTVPLLDAARRADAGAVARISLYPKKHGAASWEALFSPTAAFSELAAAAHGGAPGESLWSWMLRFHNYKRLKSIVPPKDFGARFDVTNSVLWGSPEQKNNSPGVSHLRVAGRV